MSKLVAGSQYLVCVRYAYATRLKQLLQIGNCILHKHMQLEMEYAFNYFDTHRFLDI